MGKVVEIQKLKIDSKQLASINMQMQFCRQQIKITTEQNVIDELESLLEDYRAELTSYA